MTTYHLIPAHDTWNLTREGNQGSVVIGTGDGPAGIHTKAQALIDAGQYLNHLGEVAWLRVHNEDGSFEEELTYPTQGPSHQAADA